jgi:ketosteroid isomerase-like protein
MRTILAAILTAFLALATAPASAADDLAATAKAAITAFLDGVVGGREALAPQLAPEFQVMRENGIGYGRDGYLEGAIGEVKAKPDFSIEDVVATAEGDVMVARYMLRINEVIEGAAVEKRAPRLTVFHRIDGQWKVAAHANFGAVD